MLRKSAGLPFTVNNPSSLHGFNSTVDQSIQNKWRWVYHRTTVGKTCRVSQTTPACIVALLQHEIHCVSPKTKLVIEEETK
jgi:hypothetical protein